jgi:hypothetical protein
MPKPEGWSDAMLAARDRCVTKLKSKGMEESKAYAICTAAQNEGHKAKQDQGRAT